MRQGARSPGRAAAAARPRAERGPPAGPRRAVSRSSQRPHALASTCPSLCLDLTHLPRNRHTTAGRATCECPFRAWSAGSAIRQTRRLGRPALLPACSVGERGRARRAAGTCSWPGGASGPAASSSLSLSRSMNRSGAPDSRRRRRRDRAAPSESLIARAAGPPTPAGASPVSPAWLRSSHSRAGPPRRRRGLSAVGCVAPYPREGGGAQVVAKWRAGPHGMCMLRQRKAATVLHAGAD